MTARDEVIIQHLKNLITLVSSQPCEPIPKAVSHEVEHIEMLTIQECAEEFKGLTQNTIRQLVRQGKIKYIRRGQEWKDSCKQNFAGGISKQQLINGSVKPYITNHPALETGRELSEKGKYIGKYHKERQ